MSRISYLSDLLSSVFARRDAGESMMDERSFADLCDAILSHQGESSGGRLSRALLKKFDRASSDEQLAFFHLLAERFDINPDHAIRAAQRYAKDTSAESLSILMQSVEPRRQELFRRLNRLPGATNELVKMRALLLNNSRTDADLQRIDLDFQQLFTSWFNQGFLVMRQIDWHTPASILEKIIAYEAVHEISSWGALRKRLEPEDRRCFAFFHPAMLDEPLIFVEVALTVDSPESIGEILEGDRRILSENEARTAVFYSISNCQKGLAGVSFGSFLIKQVANELSRSVPSLTTFRTLSPVPGFVRWVNTQLASLDSNGASVEIDNTEPSFGVPVQALKLAKEVSESETFEFTESDKAHLQRLVAHYLLQESRADEQPLDPVARFHLGNGASLDAVLPEADVYKKGLSQSAGVMVSYLYDLENISSNHELYADERQLVSSDAVASLLEPDKRKRRLAG